jgi:hypothetical protein
MIEVMYIDTKLIAELSHQASLRGTKQSISYTNLLNEIILDLHSRFLFTIKLLLVDCPK